MAKKKELRARVRYNKGIPGASPDDASLGPFDAESFVLETWDEEYKSWCTDTIAPLRRCVEYPDAKEAEFINYTLMMRLFQLMRLGYSIYLAKAGEE